jgi:hypothetical protein
MTRMDLTDLVDRIGRSLLVGLVLGVSAQSGPSRAQDVGAARPQLIKTDALTEQQFRRQFRRLPDAAVIEIEGRRATVGELRAESVRRQREAAARLEAATRQARAAVESRRLELERRQQAQLEADNARALAEFSRLTAAPDAARAQRFEAIREEASRLRARAPRASPAERARIEARAAELLEELRQFEAVAVPPG